MMFEETQQLEQLITEKHQVLVQLHTLSRYQLQLAGSVDHVDDLMRVVAAKQTLIEQLLHTDQLLNPFREQEPESRVWPSPADRVRVAELARKCEGLLEELKKIESESEEVVRTKRDEVASQLQATRQSTVTLDGYSSSHNPSPHFDLTAE